MYHADVGVAVPLFGLAPGKLKQWLAQYGDTVGSMSVSTFKRLLQSGKSSPSGWWCGPPPSGLADVVDGQSVLNLRADHATSAAIQLPHYTAASLEVTGFHHLRLFCATARQPLGPRSSCLAFFPRLCAGRAARTAWSRRRGRNRSRERFASGERSTRLLLPARGGAPLLTLCSHALRWLPLPPQAAWACTAQSGRVLRRRCASRARPCAQNLKLLTACSRCPVAACVRASIISLGSGARRLLPLPLLAAWARTSRSERLLRRRCASRAH